MREQEIRRQFNNPTADLAIARASSPFANRERNKINKPQTGIRTPEQLLEAVKELYREGFCSRSYLDSACRRFNLEPERLKTQEAS